MKQKSHSGAKKRVKKTASGKFLMKKSAVKHLLTNKSKRQKKAHKSGKQMAPGDAKNFKKLLFN
ncbi:MAG: large ribosomal subunit protein bL35 [Candidatus Altimarinota bacterium]|jgi:large subunit ribosomal protein L35